MEERVSLKSKLWLSSADGFCGTLCGLITGGGLTYFFTKWMGLDVPKASLVWLILVSGMPLMIHYLVISLTVPSPKSEDDFLISGTVHHFMQLPLSYVG